MKLGEHIFSLEEYFKLIEQVREDNYLTDVRFLFFYLKKLEKLMVLRKSVTTNYEQCGGRSSTTVIKELQLDKSVKTKHIDTLSSNELQEFIMSNANKIKYNDSNSSICGKTQTRIDTFHYDRDPEYFLEYLYVERPYRNCGLASILINEAKNSSINNDVFTLAGSMQPLDATPDRFLKFRQWLNRQHFKSGRFANLSYVDFYTLSKIYNKLGFNIDYNPALTHPRIEMQLTPESIPEDKKLPDEFTRYLKNKQTTILFK